MEKEFEELTTEEMAKLSEPEIKMYIAQGKDEKEIRIEIDNCKNILRRLM